ncbi:MAG: uncharacterized protein V7641_643 [Blastocatellia bacterium]
MSGEPLDSIFLGWHGFDGDRRFAFVRKGVLAGIPWLTASKLPQLISYKPVRRDTDNITELPTHVLTPGGQKLELRGEALRQELSNAYGAPVEVMQLDQGIFDEAKISIISHSTIQAIEKEAGISLDVSRFRPNILLETIDHRSFVEDGWLKKTIQFGEATDGPAIYVQMRDLRCMMINLDPATADANPQVLKAVARMNDVYAGVYATVLSVGKVTVGDRLYLREQ